MIKLAQEIPTCRLAEWAPLSDMDFVLAHKVLEDKEYARHFKERHWERELLLDNSYHELGVPLEVSDLLEAAKRCRADYVIAPDRVGDVDFNAAQYSAASTGLKPYGYKIAVVMTGTPSSQIPQGEFLRYHAEREEFLRSVRGADMLCCTFKEPERLLWYLQSSRAWSWPRVHLLGCAELEELLAWKVPSMQPGKKFSMDTGKALKWALLGQRLDQLKSVRLSAATTTAGLPSEASQKLLEVKEYQCTPEVEQLFRHNVRVLRSYL